MDFSFKQYLDYNQDFKGKPVYNLPFWQCSIVEAGTSHVNIALNKNELRTFILIHQMSYAGAGSAFPTNFIDSRYPANKLIQFSDTYAFDNIWEFNYICEGNSLDIVCNNPAIQFSLLVQIVTQEKN